MIHEAYVSFEVAKLLKEKGFNEPCRSYYLYDGDFRNCTVEITSKHCLFDQVLRPTQQMALAWLREKGILLWTYPIIPLPVKDMVTFHWRWTGKRQRHDAPQFDAKCSYDTYEEATEAALKYSLENLI